MASRFVSLSVSALALGCVVVAVSPPPATARPDGGHGLGRMGPANARTVAVSPSSGPDFEMPFGCGQRWTGTTRSSHSPSVYTVDWNTPNDLGKPALASAPGIVTRAVTLTGSYGRYVVIDHGGGYSTLYAHLNQIVTTVGTYVDQGDLIGYVGGSGNVTGPHLHFEERKDGAYFPPYFHRRTFSFGTTMASQNCGDRPVSGDWDGNGVTDVGVDRSASTGTTFWLQLARSSRSIAYGAPGDVPFTGDWDANRTHEVGLRRLGSTSYVRRTPSGAGSWVYGMGYATDIPVSGDWNGDRKTDLGVYRPSNHTFSLRADSGAYTVVRWGSAGQVPVTGDWNGDRRTDVGTFDPTTGMWSLRVPSGASYVTVQYRYGQLGDLPVTGDWDGNGRSETGVWRTGTGTFWRRVPVAGSATAVRNVTTQYGYAR